MNETFVNDLAVALRNVGTIHHVGEEWHSYTGEIPVGGVPYTGHMVEREVYSALWAYAQEKELVKTEAEWQQIATANNGNVPFYSDGDGSTTFRVPKIVGYVKGASKVSEVGSYIAEGLPNITGKTGAARDDYSDAPSGAFYNNSARSGLEADNGNSVPEIDFDASLSNPIYGNSEHVTPETSTVMFGVYAFGAIVNAGELNATTLSTGLARVESDLASVVRSVNGIKSDTSGDVSLKVSEKFNGQYALVSTGQTCTITGLTPYRPLYLLVYCSNSANLSMQVASGCAYNSEYVGVALTNPILIARGDQSRTGYGVVVPTGTSVVLTFNYSGTAPQGTIIAYQ